MQILIDIDQHWPRGSDKSGYFLLTHCEIGQFFWLALKCNTCLQIFVLGILFPRFMWKSIQYLCCFDTLHYTHWVDYSYDSYGQQPWRWTNPKMWASARSLQLFWAHIWRVAILMTSTWAFSLTYNVENSAEELFFGNLVRFADSIKTERERERESQSQRVRESMWVSAILGVRGDQRFRPLNPSCLCVRQDKRRSEQRACMLRVNKRPHPPVIQTAWRQRHAHLIRATSTAHLWTLAPSEMKHGTSDLGEPKRTRCCEIVDHKESSARGTDPRGPIQTPNNFKWKSEKKHLRFTSLCKTRKL